MQMDKDIIMIQQPDSVVHTVNVVPKEQIKLDTSKKDIEVSVTHTDSLVVEDSVASAPVFYYTFKPYDYSYSVSVLAQDDSPFMLADSVRSIKKSDMINIDSVFAAVHVPAHSRKSLFTNHEQPRQSFMEYKRNFEGDSVWIFIFLLTIVMSVGWMFNSWRQRITQILAGCFGRRKMNLLFHQGNVLTEIINFPLLFSFCVLFSLFAYGVLKHYGISLFYDNDFLNYVILLLGTGLFVLLKQGVALFLANVFQYRGVKSYLLNNICFYSLETMILLPSVFFLFYTAGVYMNFAISFLIILLSVVICIRLSRGLMMVLFESKFSQFNLFYYLCILETVPFLVLIKLITV
jgi:hypothetical protein